MEKKSFKKKIRIGFIGQGFIGKNYADDFENRGFQVIRFSLEPEYEKNKELIKGCDIVFIAVPTPTTLKGYDGSIVKGVLSLVGEGKIAVIKSTLLPGTIVKMQKMYPTKFILHSPEFLTEANASHDAAHPLRNIIGIPISNEIFEEKAKLVTSILPKSPYSLICKAEEAELIKYGSNNFLFLKVVYINLLYDYASKMGADWRKVAEAISADPRIGKSHMEPYHKTSGRNGRGAGGHCFIKDMEALIEGYKKVNPEDDKGIKFLEAARDKNLDLLICSGKDLDLVAEVYGETYLKKNNP